MMTVVMFEEEVIGSTMKEVKIARRVELTRRGVDEFCV